MNEERPETLEYASPPGDRPRRVGHLALQFIGGFLSAVAVVLLLIPATGEGPMVPAVMRALATVVGPAAALLIGSAVYAHRRLGWRGFGAGVAVGFLLAGLVAGLCVPMLGP
jgi:hypothetical protein